MAAVKAVIMEKQGNAIGLTVKEYPEPALEPGGCTAQNAVQRGLWNRRPHNRVSNLDGLLPK
jgi:hypothetical protein